ncbi:ribosome-binding factor A [candidate division KSB3 bacterium]|uniref:Ribosome-binding factor A n=1 Tax=candidate division KSB3 bacterium TaxID=2044937 RepID=A0A2G6KJL3_9BACT|nr:MAG: ribosome-binding factor A [candidate division KSB3 bacterium]
MKTYKRADRVKHLLQEEMSRILQREIKDPRVKFVTVTDVKLTSDLRDAKVFISSLDPTTDREEMLNGLDRATGYIRGELGRRLKLKYVPHITFFADDSFDQQERILDLIDQIHDDTDQEEPNELLTS